MSRDEQIGDLYGATKGRTQIILITDEQLDDAGLGAFLADAAKLARPVAGLTVPGGQP